MNYKTILINGLRNLIYLALGILAGITWLKSEQGETTAERLSLDSEESQVETKRTEDLKNEADKFLETHDPIGPDGKPTDEWLQFLERQRAIAKQRGDQASYLSRFPFVR